LVDPDGVARAATFGAHALGQPIVGTLATLRSFDTAALSVHHARHYTSSSGVLAVSGRLPPRATLLKRLERAFMRLPRGRRVVAPRYRATHAPPRLTIVRTHASQVSLRISSIGPGRRSQQARAAELLLRVIDDGNATRLYDRLCDRLGLCYDVSAGFEPYSDVGFFDIAADAAEASIPRVLDELLDMLFELAHAGPRPDEVQKAAQRARWQADRARDQPEGLAELAATGLLFGDVTSPGERAERLSGVTPAAMKRVAAQLFHPRALSVSLVGPVSRATERAIEASLLRFSRRRP
jgi:predicted Zn-dependent peptidase